MRLGNRVALVSESLPAGLTETGWHHTLTPGEESYVRLTEAFAAMAHGPDPQQSPRFASPRSASRDAGSRETHRDRGPVARSCTTRLSPTAASARRLGG